MILIIYKHLTFPIFPFLVVTFTVRFNPLNKSTFLPGIDGAAECLYISIQNASFAFGTLFQLAIDSSLIFFCDSADNLYFGPVVIDFVIPDFVSFGSSLMESGFKPGCGSCKRHIFFTIILFE